MKFLVVLAITMFATIFTYIIYIKYIKKTPNKINHELQYYTTSNNKTLPTILILFSPECGPCQILSQNIYVNRDSLEKVNIILASTKDSLTTNSFFEKISGSWSRDMRKSKVIYHSRNKIGSYFTEMGLPKVYFFDKNGQIGYKLDGPIRIDSIKMILKKYE